MTDPIADIRQQNLDVYRVSPGRLREDVSQEAQVAHDYRGRLAYELLQNADDAMESSDDHHDRIAFYVTDRELWVANTGRPLTVPDVEGLCGLGASSKVDATGTRRASIGHKGLGFKSVLEITDAPTAFSTTYSFQLGEQHAHAVVGPVFEQLGRAQPKRLPAMRFPAEVSEEPDAWIKFRDDGFNTAFLFPFAPRMEPTQRQRLAELLLDLPVTTVVFLKHLEEVTVTVDQGGRSESRSWRTTRRRRAVSGESTPVDGLRESGLYEVEVVGTDQPEANFLLAHEDSVDIGPHRDGLSGPAWEGVELSEVSVAVLDPTEHDDAMPEAWRHFHVFLPTAETCPYPILVNGAFTTDLSRQRVRIDRRGHDYNAHLIREAAGLFRRGLAPTLAENGPDRLLAALDHGEGSDDADSAGALLHDALVDALVDLAFLPSGRDVRTLPQTVMPPLEIGEDGAAFRDVLGDAADAEGRRLPDAQLCAQRLARIAADHGAARLTGPRALDLLARRTDPTRSRLVDHESGGFALDPVVELASSLWSNADPEVRGELEGLAKQLPLFPVQASEDGTVRRVALEERAAFYPPQSAKQDLPLSGLAFMLHDICWGALLPNERKALLDDRMTVWKALFDVSDFRFEEVMRASVLPALALTRDERAEAMRQGLRSVEALAAICQLAGSQTKPDRPLRYQRLQSDRALINLSRLPVPCVVDGDEVWEPAFKVYFGRDWFPQDSVEHVIDAMDDPSKLPLPRLAPPERFLGLLAQYQDVHEDLEAADEIDDDEVGLDEDFDQPIETTERDRWVDFLSWVGVNRCLRPVHFHDVMDEKTWLSTKDLAQPQGWAFADLRDEWDDFEAHIRSQLDSHPAAEGKVPYLYECHDVEGLGDIMAQAQTDKTAGVARALWRHLALHWDMYQRFTTLELAIVAEGTSPGRRTIPRARPEEQLELGDNLWVHRMRRAGICPTSHGPRRPDVAWMPGPEIDRRFTRSRGRRAGEILPVLQVGDGLPPRTVRSLADRLGVRLEINPSTFTVEDAGGVCRRLAHLYGVDEGEPVTNEALRFTIRPVYRQVFALLSGAKVPGEPMVDVPMLAEGPEGFRFLPAGEVLYARSPGTKERSGVGDRIATFVIEADPAATRPLTAIFGMKTLEDALDWVPDPGEAALDGSDLEEFRLNLGALAPWLLARLRADRADAAAEDQAALLEFVERVEPVTELQLACYQEGELVTAPRPRSYYVSTPPKGEPRQAFLVWEGAPWPPNPDARQALAMAMADALGVNHVETFLAFIDADDSGRRQLLDLAGAVSFYDEIVEELRGPSGREVETGDSNADDEDEAGGPSVMTAAPEAETHETAATGVTPVASGSPGAVKIPLVSLDDYELTGEIELVAGEAPRGTSTSTSGPSGSSTGTGSGAGGSGQSSRGSSAAPGMDLSELDRIGMLITMDYELRRLRDGGLNPHVVPGDSEPGDTIVVDVSTPAAVQRAKDASAVFKAVLEDLRAEGVSELHPGFDILTIADGKLDRAIELKSSGVDARVQAMSWNEWKSASKSALRESFWLYLVNNLRADLPAAPYVRAIHDPFGTLLGKQTADTTVRRAVQLRVREFEEAEQLELRPRRRTIPS